MLTMDEIARLEIHPMCFGCDGDRCYLAFCAHDVKMTFKDGRTVKRGLNRRTIIELLEKHHHAHDDDACYVHFALQRERRAF